MRRVLAISSLLLLSLSLPAAAKASTPVDDATASTPVRVSTGVIQPVLLDSVNLTLPSSFSNFMVPEGAEVDLTFTVDENGTPQNIHVVKSYNPFWDARVLEAVRQFHYRPGTVDNQPVAIDMNLTINIAR
jgi:TonB family protein